MKMPDYQSQYPITPPRLAAPWQIPHPAPHHHPATTATAAFPAIQCRSGSSAKSAQAMPAEMAGTQNRVETGSNNCKQEHTLFLYCFDYELFVKMF